MQSGKLQKLIFIASLALCIVSLLSVVFLARLYLTERNQSITSARNIANEIANTAAAEIEETIHKVPIIAQSIADDLSSGRLKDREVEDRLIRELKMNPEMGAISAAYCPHFVPDFAPQADRNLYCPFSYENEGGNIVIIRVEDMYDYTLPDGTIGPDGKPIDTSWYHNPLAKGPTWGDLVWGAGLKEYWAGFGTPFYRVPASTALHPLQAPVPAGIIDVSFNLNKFQEYMGAIHLGRPEAGYGFMLSRTGKFISHPIDEFVEEERTISEFDDALTVEGLWKQFYSERRGRIITLDHVDAKSGRSSWVFLTPIPESGWWVGIVLDKDSIFRSMQLDERVKRQQIGIVIGILAFMFFLSVLLFRAYKVTNLGLWAISASFSVLCIGGIAYLWMLNTTGLAGENPQHVVLTNRAISEKVTSDYGRNIIEPIYVPTGVFIQSMDFTTAHEVLLTGYIWQKYTDDMPDWVRPDPGEIGFILPQEIGWRMTTEAYRQKEGDQEVIGWNVRATLRQEFDYSQYPFHRQDVRVIMGHKDFDQRVILTPDLVSYSTIAPDSMPGLDRDFFLEGWNVDRTFFSYRESRYNTDFGLSSYIGQQRYPELYFHIGLTRQFINSFISGVIPITVVLVLLSAVLQIATRREEKIKIIGFSTAAVLAYCAALFFVTVLSHVNLRTGLEAPATIIYLEYFYFLAYAAILLVSVNAILFAQGNIGWIQYQENIIIRLLFWPVILGTLLIITLVTFM